MPTLGFQCWPTAHDDLPLGILFQSLENPEQAFYSQQPTPVKREDYSVYEFTDFGAWLSVGQAGSGNIQLSSLAKAYREKNESQNLNLDTVRAANYKLLNSEAIFDTIRSQEPARRWINNAAARRRKVYMLVGKQTISDSVFSREVRSSTQGSFRAAVPVTQALGITEDVLSGAVNPAVSASASEHHTAGARLHAKDEMIWCISYRELKYKFLSRKDLDKAQLRDTKIWDLSGLSRGATEEPTQVIEVSLGDEIHLAANH
ncbi:hypothetical protein QBC40DRAFT_26048 [Triangularia verruculosa]|uniref:Uncharacterized protein n=1 Tax=Triangularia verruculosa TaxID=2587418 RepID=A0AAN6XAB3_9PEZI|nr:hypothetical protein QBC40DRAFT_26048 [Triangularia verruculosa]